MDGNGQINFKVVCEEGYRVKDVVVTPGYPAYKNLKTSADSKETDVIPENTYRVTKITSDITITVTVEALAE